MGVVIFYALVNWMPLMFKDAGMDPKTATLISAAALVVKQLAEK
jgi:AAHS family 4-hydroxybenzoate transporter-like MFS transporter